MGSSSAGPLPGVPFMNLGYPYALAAVYAAAGPSVAAALTLQALLGSLAAVLVALAARELFHGDTAAWIAGGIYAAYAGAIFYDGLLLTPSLTNLALAAALYGAARYLDSGATGAAMMAGIALSLAAVLRSTRCCSCRGSWPSSFWRACPRTRGAGSRGPPRSSPPPSPCPGAFVLANGLTRGEWAPISGNGGMNFWIGNNRDAEGVYQAAGFLTSQTAQAEGRAFLSEARRRTGRYEMTRPRRRARCGSARASARSRRARAGGFRSAAARRRSSGTATRRRRTWGWNSSRGSRPCCGGLRWSSRCSARSGSAGSRFSRRRGDAPRPRSCSCSSREAEIDVGEAIHRTDQDEIERPQAEYGEGIRREDHKDIARDPEGGGDRVHREDEIRDLNGQESDKQRRCHQHPVHPAHKALAHVVRRHREKTTEEPNRGVSFGIDELATHAPSGPRDNQEGAEDVEDPAEMVDQGCADCDQRRHERPARRILRRTGRGADTQPVRRRLGGEGRRQRCCRCSATSRSDRRRSTPLHSPIFPCRPSTTPKTTLTPIQAPLTIRAFRRVDARSPRCTAKSTARRTRINAPAASQHHRGVCTKVAP